MATNFSIPYMLPPVSLLPPAADAAGRTGSFRSLRHSQKAFVIAKVNQGNAAPVTLTLLQATGVSGAGSKGVNAVPIWLNDATAASDALVAQTAAAAFTTDATLAEKFVVFEILPEAAMDITNGYTAIALQTSASNAANITDATLHVLTDFPGAKIPTTYSDIS
jgi:hypothetical protein